MGKTVLHAACREERLEVIQFLVEKGAALNTMDKHGRTPLHMAAAMDNYSIIGYADCILGKFTWLNNLHFLIPGSALEAES